MGCAGRKGWPQDVGVSRAGDRIFPAPEKSLEISDFRCGGHPRQGLAFALSIRSRVGWIQAGPHASGCDEPGQIGRSSPKSFSPSAVVSPAPFGARLTTVQPAPTAWPRAALAFGKVTLRILLRACEPANSPESAPPQPDPGRFSLFPLASSRLWGLPGGRTHGQPGPWCRRSVPDQEQVPVEPARHTEYSGHSAQVLRLRTPGQSPRMPRWLRAKS
jgi:hypothetical protein